MKKLVLSMLVMLFFLTGSALSQVIADFEEADDGFAVAWGSGLALSQMADPTGLSAGVLSAAIDVANGGGAMSKANVEAMGAKLGTFFVYLPADAPDSLL
ncbi:MAG: hypothetical protein KAR38_16220, partial [Calditrichia bacterium]|nr:hypothetical protein [Calditrichia bacterium]